MRNLGIGIGLDPERAKASSGFDGNFAALGDCQLFFDGQDASTQWQDAAGTIPAGIGDTIQKWDDKSGHGNDLSRVQVIASVSDSGLNGNRGVYGGGGMNTGGTISQGALSDPYTIFTVVDLVNSATNNQTVHDGIGAANRNDALWSSAGARWVRFPGYKPTSGTTPSPNDACMRS